MVSDHSHTNPFDESFYQSGSYVVDTKPVQPDDLKKREANKNRDNFIVDLKSNTLIMVVESDAVMRLKELIKKLDVPKKMVYIEVLLFEKRYKMQNDFGLNMLKIGDTTLLSSPPNIFVSDDWKNYFNWNETKGVFQYMLSHLSRDDDHFNMGYRFLLNRDDIYINANPTIVAINQTEASIEIVQERSISTGTTSLDNNQANSKETFTRAQYGVYIKVTPTIHLHDESDPYDDPTDYITLKNDIVFDEVDPDSDPSRPNISRRKIFNEAIIANGQTVILGGLRRKTSRDSKDSLPFIGEIPGLGKFFSNTVTEDNSTDMYMLITPKIIADPVHDFQQMRQVELCRRPGDIPCFMACLHEAQEYEKRRLFQGAMRILGCPSKSRCSDTEGPFDGR